MTPAARAVLIVLGAFAACSAEAAEPPLLRGTFGGPAEGPPSASGIYVGGRGGLSTMRDTAYDAGANTISSSTQLIPPFVDLLTGQLIGPFLIETRRVLTVRVAQAYENGAAYSGFVGYDFGTFMDGFGARMEAEVGHFSHNVRTALVTGIDQTTTTVTSPSEVVTVRTAPEQVATRYDSGVSGRTSVTYLLANYYIDWNLGWVRPFVGGGLGVGHVQMQNHVVPTMGVVMNHSNWGWAYQFGGGLSFDLMPNVTLEAGYRFVGVRDVTMTSGAGQTDKVSVNTQQANVGVRVRF